MNSSGNYKKEIRAKQSTDQAGAGHKRGAVERGGAGRGGTRRALGEPRHAGRDRNPELEKMSEIYSPSGNVGHPTKRPEAGASR